MIIGAAEEGFMYIVMFVLDDSKQLDAVLEAWQAIGIGGATIMESTGSFRRRQVRPLGARYIFSAIQAVENVERGQYTLFTIVPDLEKVQACQAAVEEIIGDLNDQDTGILAAWELAHVKGVPLGADTTEDEA
jgi:hypothetical protein